VIDFGRTYIAADPGAIGAIAVINSDRLYLFDAPMAQVKRGKGKKPTTDGPALFSLLELLADAYPDAVLVVEKVWGVKGQSASTGAALGAARTWLEAGILHAWKRPPVLVAPQRWKADVGLFKKDKKASVTLAGKVWPQHNALFTPKRLVLTAAQCEGRAEAALIAWHAAGGRA
jgi:hypothetical protein